MFEQAIAMGTFDASVMALQAQQEGRIMDTQVRLDILYGYARFDAYNRQYIPPTPCPYCGRTAQTHAHRSCDGCGAPKEKR